MANPLYNALSASGGQRGPMNFMQFMQQMRGKNPNEVMQQLLSSGKLNQNQLNQAQQMVKQLESQFSGFKSMFGFK